MNSQGRSSLAGTGMTLALAGALVIAQAVTIVPAQAAPAKERRPTASTGWRVAASVAVKSRIAVMTDIDADSGGDAWAIGESATMDGPAHPVIEHWTGKAWRPVRLPGKIRKAFYPRNSVLAGIGAASPTDVWIFDPDGQYLRLLGGKWAMGRLPRPKVGRLFADSVKVLNPNDVWVFGGHSGCSLHPSPANCAPYAARFNGRSWRLYRLPGEQNDVGDVSALSANDIWTITGTGRQSSVLRWNGSGWRVLPVQPRLPASGELTAITAISDSDIWVGGDAPNSKHGTYELIRHWNGRTWTNASPAAKQTSKEPVVEDLVPDGRGGIWELADAGNYDESSRLRHFSHGRWATTDNVDWLLFELAAVPGTGSTWGVGTSANVSRGLIVVHGRRPR